MSNSDALHARPTAPATEAHSAHTVRPSRPAAVRLVAWQLAVGPVRVGWRKVVVNRRAA